MSREQATPAKSDANRKTVLLLVSLVFFMSGFSFALVPLYDIFCEVTGLNGKVSGSPAVVNAVQVDENRLVKVQFIANVDQKTPWKFKPAVFEMEVHPGQMMDTSFYAENLSNSNKVAQAVPSVTPGIGAKHLNKTECFCFTQQAFKPGESREMPLRFMVDPELPEEITTLTLSYSFFELDKVAVK